MITEEDLIESLTNKGMLKDKSLTDRGKGYCEMLLNINKESRRFAILYAYNECKKSKDINELNSKLKHFQNTLIQFNINFLEELKWLKKNNLI